MSGRRRFMNSIRYCTVSLLVLLSNISGVAAQVEATNQDVPIQVRLKPDKNTIMLGEPLFLAFEVTNISGEQLCIRVGGDYRNKFGRPNRFQVTVKTVDGTELPQLEVITLGGLSGCETIEVGDTHTVRLFLPHWATIERTGSYRVNVKNAMSFSSHEPPGGSSKPKYSMLADVSAEFAVVRSERNKIGEIINLLGSIMLDSSDPRSTESATALASIHDERVISYFAEALRKFRDDDVRSLKIREINIKERSIAALATYDDDRAIDALQAAMISSSDFTRLDLATAFGNSPHRSAIKLLLKMQDDKYSTVRLSVALALAKVKTKESHAALRKLLKDEVEDVRTAAKESLDKLDH